MYGHGTGRCGKEGGVLRGRGVLGGKGTYSEGRARTRRGGHVPAGRGTVVARRGLNCTYLARPISPITDMAWSILRAHICCHITHAKPEDTQSERERERERQRERQRQRETERERQRQKQRDKESE